MDDLDKGSTSNEHPASAYHMPGTELRAPACPGPGTGRAGQDVFRRPRLAMRCLAGAGPARAASLARSGLSAATGFLLVVAGLLALPLQAQAQTTLVSNTGQANSGGRTVDGVEFAQAFGTGSNTAGYDLESIVLSLGNAPSGTATFTVTVRENASGDPSGTALYTLTTPDPIVDNDLNAFTAPAGATLDANTTYRVVASYSSVTGGPNWWRVLLSNGLDSGGATGWTIDSPYKTDSRTAPDGWEVASSSRGMKLQVKGTVKGGTTLSTDATLSALALADNDGNAVSLNPSFATGTTAYTASVANSVSSITLTPTVNESHATVEYLNASDAAITDTDTTTPALDTPLVVGDNTFKVKVTAEDTTTQTYTLVVTLAAAPPPPGNCASGAVWCTTMTVASVLFGNARGFRSSMDYAGVGDGGALDSESFTTGGVDYRVKQLYVGSNLEFELSAGLSSYVDHTLEIAGESLPLSDADYVDSTGQTFSFDRFWLAVNAPSLNNVNYRTTLAVGQVVPVCLRTGTQVCPAKDTTTDLTDASLSEMSLSDGNGNVVALTPTFTSDTPDYTASVGNEIGTARLFATTKNENATLVIAYGIYTNQSSPEDVGLVAGSTTVTVTVTAADGTTTQDYTIAVTRAAPPPPPLPPTNCEADAIWCTAMTVGEVIDDLNVNPTGYCGPGATTNIDCFYGSVSDDDFTLDQTDYTVESVRWEPYNPTYLHLTLDRDFPDASLDRLTLRVGTYAFALADATGNTTTNFYNNYRMVAYRRAGPYCARPW